MKKRNCQTNMIRCKMKLLKTMTFRGGRVQSATPGIIKKQTGLEMSQKSNFKPKNQDKEPIKSQISERYTNGKGKQSSLKLSIATSFL